MSDEAGPTNPGRDSMRPIAIAYSAMALGVVAFWTFAVYQLIQLFGLD